MTEEAHGRGPVPAVVFLLTLLAMVSCASARASGTGAGRMAGEPEAAVRVSLVFFIHGDGDYLYHDDAGRALRADEAALSGAQHAAEANPQAEVFIFHEKRKTRAWLFFPKHDGEFFYYRGGVLAAHEEYRRGSHPSQFAYAAGRYRRFRSHGEGDVTTIVLYYGHEIPETGGEGYHASYEDMPFTIDTLAAGLRLMQEGGAPFDIAVVSTCYNGTPRSIAALAPYARYIIASPDNLHLSYFTFHSFALPESAASGATSAALARTMARDAFETLSRTVQTAVSVAVYDAQLVQPYIQTVDSLYARSLEALKEHPDAVRDHCDCAQRSGFSAPDMGRGVDIFYRPARFGQKKSAAAHSGWECWNIPDGRSE